MTGNENAERAQSEFEGSEFIKVTENLTIGSISPQARELLDTVMLEWKNHRKQKRKLGIKRRETIYGFAYWLIRWSDLVQPKQKRGLKP